MTSVDQAATGWRLVPVDDIERSYSDSLLPSEMIYAGMAALDQAETDMANYVSGETTDWDQGMIAVSVYRAMLYAAPQPGVTADLRQKLIDMIDSDDAFTASVMDENRIWLATILADKALSLISSNPTQKEQGA